MPRKFSEERTRKEMKVPQLEQAGWYLRDDSKVLGSFGSLLMEVFNA